VVVGIGPVLAVHRWAVGTASSTAASWPATAAAATLIPGLSAVTVPSATTTATPASFLSHVSQNPYLNPLKLELTKSVMKSRPAIGHAIDA
jgi:hypothetical protein